MYVNINLGYEFFSLKLQINKVLYQICNEVGFLWFITRIIAATTDIQVKPK